MLTLSFGPKLILKNSLRHRLSTRKLTISHDDFRRGRGAKSRPNRGATNYVAPHNSLR